MNEYTNTLVGFPLSSKFDLKIGGLYKYTPFFEVGKSTYLLWAKSPKEFIAASKESMAKHGDNYLIYLPKKWYIEGQPAHDKIIMLTDIDQIIMSATPNLFASTRSWMTCLTFICGSQKICTHFSVGSAWHKQYFQKII